VHDKLLRALIENPADAHSWTVFHDLLLARGDPRGQLAVASDPEALLRSLAPTWFGADARVEGQRVVVGGDPDDPLAQASSVALHFERGHVHRLQLNIINDSLDTDEHGPKWGRDWMPGLIQQVLEQPVGQLIQTIEICQRPDWSGDTCCAALLEVLMLGAPLAARTLTWGCDHDWEFAELPDCAPLLLAAPHLESVTLQGVSGLRSTLYHPRLHTLGLGAMEPESLEVFAGLELPSLEHLTLWLEFDDTREVDSEFECERLEPLLAATLPGLRTLALPGCPQVDAVVATLPHARWFSQLDTLTLIGAELSPASTKLLASASYAHIGVITQRHGKTS
jgi:hypothetical protein